MRRLGIVLPVLLACGAVSARADKLLVPTAKQAVELANQKIDASARNHILIIEGDHSDSDMRPRQWDITFYDTAKKHGGVLVRVKDGAVVSTSRSVRLFDDARMSRFERNFSGYDNSEVMNASRWRMDSDEVITKALRHPSLKQVQATEVRLTLRKLSDGDVPPVWHVKVRARQLDKPKRDRWVGYEEFNADYGELLVDQLRVDRLVR